MTDSTDCPDVTFLRQFLDGNELDGGVSDWNRDRVEQHVNACELCQRAIERLVAGQESWEGAARQLAELGGRLDASSTETPALRDLIDHEKDHLPDTLISGASCGGPENLAAIPLDFLQPTDQPDSRGRLGTYEVLEVVGRGGMGLVLKAYDPSLRRIVAIKVMAGHLASSPLARRRFVREARAAAAVSHDHVVAIYAVEENVDPPFIVMQFVGGKTLQERLVASGSLSIAEILRIGMQTASGLAAAHAQGLVHRDIKPANILLENGVERVKITDFGLARAVDDVGMTRTGVVAGTPQFMAPEQANGESIDVRSDLFSLGSVMYMLCTGRPPFRATTTMGLLRRICEETPRPIRELNPEIPEWLEAIVFKLLKKKPADRYQTAKEIADLLGNWLAHVQHPTSVPIPVAPIIAPLTGQADVIQAQNEKVATARSIIAPKPSSRLSLWGNYSGSIPCDGDKKSVIDHGIARLTQTGFRLGEQTESRVTMIGPGRKRIYRVSVASAVEIRSDAETLILDVRLTRVRILYGILLFIAIATAPFAGPLWGPIQVVLVFLWLLGRRRELQQVFDRLLVDLATDPQASGDSFNFAELNTNSTNTKKALSPLSLWKDYKHSIPFSGDTQRAFDLALSTLTSAGFQLEERMDSRMRLRGPGWFNATFTTIAAASSIEMSSHAGVLGIRARFGRMRAIYCLIAMLFYGISVMVSRLGGAMVAVSFGMDGMDGIPQAQFDSLKNDASVTIFVVLWLIVGFWNYSSLRAMRAAFETFCHNIASEGTKDNAPTVEQSPSTSAENAISNSSIGLRNSTWRTLIQRLEQSFPSPIYSWTYGIWMIGSALVFGDTLDTLGFPVQHWMAVAAITAGFIWPAAVIAYAGLQKRKTGDWETTILRRPPQRLVVTPMILYFLAACGFWTWQQLTCGIVKFDIDDPNFTVTLSDLSQPQWNRSYSATFYALRLRAGKQFHWGVFHGKTVIAGGDFTLKPGEYHVLYARSPFGVGEADTAFLPGRWKFTYLTSGRPTPPLSAESQSTEYIDIADGEIRIHAQTVVNALKRLSGTQKLVRTPVPANATMAGPIICSMQLSSPPANERSPKRIDLSTVDPDTNTKTLFAHGVLFADEKALSMRLVPAGSVRPTTVYTEEPDGSIMFQFERATDDASLLTGEWNIEKCLDVKFEENVVPTRLAIANNLAMFFVTEPDAFKPLGFTMTLDPSKTPKRITLKSMTPVKGVIEVKEGVYRLDGDRLNITFAKDGRIPSDFHLGDEVFGGRLELRRSPQIHMP